MKIDIEKVKFKKIETCEDGYTIEFFGDKKERTMDVCFKTREDVFFTYNNKYIYIAVVDGRIIGLVNLDLTDVAIVNSFTFAHCQTILHNDNIKHIENTYNIKPERLELMVLNAVKDSFINIVDMELVDFKDLISKAIITVNINGTELEMTVTDGSDLGSFFRKYSNTDETSDWTNVFENLIGQKFLLVFVDDNLVGISDLEGNIMTLQEYINGGLFTLRLDEDEPESQYQLFPLEYIERSKRLINNYKKEN